MFQPLKKYVEFTGRARRKEFWLFFLMQIIATVVAQSLAAVGGSVGTIGTTLAVIIGLGLFLPGLAVSFRRLHDTNRSAWWLLIGLIPLIGALVLLFFYVQDSEPATNRFGPNPKAPGAEVFA